MKFKVIFEDDNVLVVDKPAGLVVNRSETAKEQTLQDQLTLYFNLGSNLGIGDRAGIVHRLDRETSGLLLVAKTQNAFDILQDQFKLRQIKKEYIALVHGFVKNESGSIIGSIGRIGKFGKFGVVNAGRESRSDYQAVNYYQHTHLGIKELEGITKPRIRYLQNQAKEYSLLTVFPKTGRTHQVRVHMKLLHHPVVSDLIYTPAKLLKFDLSWCPRLFLHAKGLEFYHPKSRMLAKFESGLPNELENAMLNLQEINSKVKMQNSKLL